MLQQLGSDLSCELLTRGAPDHPTGRLPVTRSVSGLGALKSAASFPGLRSRARCLSKDCFVARFVEEKKPKSRSGSPVPGFTFAPNTWCWRVESWQGLAIRIPARRCVNQRLGTDSWRVLDSFGSGVRLGVFALPPPLVLNQKPLDNGYFAP